MSGIVKYNNFQ